MLHHSPLVNSAGRVGDLKEEVDNKLFFYCYHLQQHGSQQIIISLFAMPEV
jgi:hypothetical protein